MITRKLLHDGCRLLRRHIFNKISGLGFRDILNDIGCILGAKKKEKPMLCFRCQSRNAPGGFRGAESLNETCQFLKILRSDKLP